MLLYFMRMSHLIFLPTFTTITSTLPSRCSHHLMKKYTRKELRSGKINKIPPGKRIFYKDC